MGNANDRRQRGTPNRTKVIFDAQTTKNTTGVAKARQLNATIVGNAQTAVRRVILPVFVVGPAPVDPLDEIRMKAWLVLHQIAIGNTAQYVTGAIAGGADPIAALSSATIDRAFRSANAASGGHFNDAQIKVAVKVVSGMLGGKAQQIAALPAVLLLIGEARAARRASSSGESSQLEEALSELDGPSYGEDDSVAQQNRNLDRMLQRQRQYDRQRGDVGDIPVVPDPARRHQPRLLRASDPSNANRHIITDMRRRNIQAESESETGWDVAARRLRGGAPVSGGMATPRVAAPIVAGPAKHQAAAAQASEARKRIRAATAPAFAAALDTAANADLIVAFVRKHPQATNLTKLRSDFVATAVRHFAQEFVRTISSAPKGTSENLALGAIIASALSQSVQRMPLLPAAAVPAMSVLIHKTLQPRLAALARMAAAIAVAPTASAGSRNTAMHELAW